MQHRTALLARVSVGVLAAGLVAVGSPHAHAQVEYGFSSDYAGDVGIENDSRVIFSENFEQADVDAVVARWEDVSGQDAMSLVSDRPAASGGATAIFFDGGAHLYKRLPPGQQEVYLRFYTKFEAECSTVHHFVHLGGYNPARDYPLGTAGIRPDGDYNWSTGIEPMGGSWAWDFYSYWMHMRSNPGGSYWGNNFLGEPSPHTVTKDEWIAVEVMIKMNDPVGSYNGEQAFWINGERKLHLGLGFPRGEWIWDTFFPDDTCTPNGPCDEYGSATPCCTDFEGFQWRNTTVLDINYLWLLHYVDADPTCGAWFDDVVVASEYIGPMGGGGAGGSGTGGTGGSGASGGTGTTGGTGGTAGSGAAAGSPALTPEDDEGGCGCRLGAPGPGERSRGHWLALLGVLLPLWRSRRRAVTERRSLPRARESG